MDDEQGQEIGPLCIGEARERRLEETLRESEARYRALFDDAGDAISIVDPEGRFVAVNRALCERLGYREDEFLTMGIGDIQPQEYHGLSRERLNQLRETGKLLFETVHVAKSGAQIPVEISSRTVTLQGKKMSISIARDIGARKRVEDELFRSRQMLQTILDHIPQRVFWKNRELQYLGANRAFASDVGVADPKDLVGRSDFDMPWSKLAETYRRDDQEVLDSGVARIHYDETSTRADGSTFWTRTSKIPLRDRDGTPLGVLGTYEDVTERKKIEQTLREKTEELDRFFNEVAALLAIATSDGHFRRLSLAWERTLGYTVEELTRCSFLEFVHPDDVAGTMSALSHLSEQQVVVDFVNRYRCKDGSYRWLEWHAVPSGVLIYTAASDITKRKQAEEAAHRSHRELRALYEIAQSTSESLDLGTVLAQAQERINALFGADGSGVYLLEDDQCTLSLYSTYNLTPEYVEKVRHIQVGEGIAGRAVATGKPQVFAIENYPEGPLKSFILEQGYRTGASIPLCSAGRSEGAMNIVLRYDRTFDDNEITMLLAIGQQLGVSIRNAQLYRKLSAELEQRKQIEQHLFEATQRAHAANLAKTAFVTNMSHEIRTPMNAILGLTHLTLQTDLSPKQRDYLLKLDSSAQLLLRVLNDVLDFSKIEAGKLTLDPVDFSLNDCLARVLSVITVRANEKGLEVRCQPDLTVPDALWGDALRLQQVLVNLLGNAVKFTDRGRVVLAVVPLATSAPSQVSLRFSVTDTGIGIDPGKIDLLFRPFTQTDATTTRRFGGTGLGLSISKRLVEMMQGEVSVESEPGVGSTFAFTATFARGTKREEPTEEAESDIEGATVLLVEDQPLNQLVAREILEQAGVRVHVVGNGAEAIAAIESVAYAAVLMDLQMPVMDGYEATRRIRLRHPDLPIIAMTAHTFVEEQEKCLRIGMNDHIGKPFDVRELYRVLARWIGRPLEKGRRKGTVRPFVPSFEAPPQIAKKAALMRTLIVGFGQYYAHVLDDLRAALACGERQRARDIVHKLLGVVGNLGAKALYAETKALDVALRGTGEVDLDPFAKELATVLTSARRLAEEPEEPRERPQVAPPDVVPLLRELEDRLRDRDLEALALAEQLRGMAPPSEPLRDVLAHIEVLDFQKALASISSLAETLGIDGLR
ncbi:MAG: PAS domain S-box protein [Myxococcales bacterium]